MPEGLEIDRTANMNGVMASYAEHVLICTGKEDRTSRIEDDESGDNLAADLKELIGRGGAYNDVSPKFCSACSCPVGRAGQKTEALIGTDAPACDSRSTTCQC